MSAPDLPNVRIAPTGLGGPRSGGRGVVAAWEVSALRTIQPGETPVWLGRGRPTPTGWPRRATGVAGRVAALPYLLLLLVLALPFAAHAQEPGITLQEAAEIALRDSPNMTLSQSGIDIAESRLRQAQSTWLPQIQVSETFTRSDNPVFVFGTLLEQGRFGPENFDPVFLNDPDALENYRLSVSARLTLFDQLRRWSRISQARTGVEQAETQSEWARQRLRFETIRAYYGVILASAQQSVAAEAVKMSEADAASMRDRVETGLLVESDLMSAEVQLSEFQQQLIQSEGQALIARTALATVMGVDAETLPEVSGDLTPKSFDAGELEQWMAAGLTDRPDVQISRLSERAAALQVRSARGEFLPRLDAFANWGASGESISDQNEDTTAGAVVSWNVLDPGRVFRLREARAAERAAEASTASVIDQAQLEIITAYRNFLSASKRLEVGEKSVDQASETLRIVRDRYEQGLTTITEILRAQTAMVQARLRQLGARYDYYTSYAALQLATGKLDTVEPFA